MTSNTQTFTPSPEHEKAIKDQLDMRNAFLREVASIEADPAYASVSLGAHKQKDLGDTAVTNVVQLPTREAAPTTVLQPSDTERTS